MGFGDSLLGFARWGGGAWGGRSMREIVKVPDRDGEPGEARSAGSRLVDLCRSARLCTVLHRDGLFRVPTRLAALASTFLASTFLASAPAFANLEGEGFDLRLSGLMKAKLDLAQTALPLSLALITITVYAAVVSLLHVRNRRQWNDHFEELNRTARDAQARRVDRAKETEVPNGSKH
jgi:hypothetical protein